MECTRQRYNLGHFYFTRHRCVEKLMTRFRIDESTIKRGKLICVCVRIKWHGMFERLTPLQRCL